MAKNQNTDRSLILSKENFSKFTKVTEDNIGDFYCKPAIFIVAIVNNKEFELLHTFNGRERIKPGYNLHSYIWDNTIVQSRYKSYLGETIEEYNEIMADFMPYIKEKIKSGMLYAIKI